MPKKTILIQKAAKLSIKFNTLTIEQDGNETHIPLEDIWLLIIETRSANISTAALSSLVDAGIGTMVCDKMHLPNGLLLPLGAHSRHSAIVEDQLAIPKPLQKRLWQRIIQAKIRNQAQVLSLCGLDEKSVSRYIASVRSGDTGGAEAAAAGAYFRLLLPDGATRHNSPYTGALDFGYAVLRAGIAREAVAGGWLVSRGIHHASSTNAFNLVDDLIEPFRPLIDLMVMKRGLDGPLTPLHKQQLTQILEHVVLVNGRRYATQTAIEMLLASLKEAIQGNDDPLLAPPVLVGLERYTIE